MQITWLFMMSILLLTVMNQLFRCLAGGVFEKTIIPSEFQPVFDFTVEE